ncbi:MAG: GIY-YIG nuclease family protein [Bacteroidetes bacterium]|nr:GIY-YIG nuclease family protein [Bacteroidota bacterium]
MKDNERFFYVYILSEKKNGILYIGVTRNLVIRTLEHRLKINKGFPEKYGLFRLVYFETFNYIDKAVQREKQLKKWNRAWKIRLIEKENKEWRDLLPGIADKEQIDYVMTSILENKDFYAD